MGRGWGPRLAAAQGSLMFGGREGLGAGVVWSDAGGIDPH